MMSSYISHLLFRALFRSQAACSFRKTSMSGKFILIHTKFQTEVCSCGNKAIIRVNFVLLLMNLLPNLLISLRFLIERLLPLLIRNPWVRQGWDF